MSAGLKLSAQLTEAKDDKTRARSIADSCYDLAARFSQLTHLAAQGHLREEELRLKRELEKARSELRETELRLQKDIEQIRADITPGSTYSNGSYRRWLIQLQSLPRW
jgi:hypothetical protein